jgi:hypothetical protein
MDPPDSFPLSLQITTTDELDDEAIARLTRQLRGELREAGVDGLEIRHSAPGPAGAKGEMEAAVLGSLIGAVVQTALPYLVTTVQVWLQRHRAQQVTINCGKATVSITANALPAELVKQLTENCASAA